MPEPLFYLGSQPVFLPEFRLFYDAVRSRIAGEFCRKYGVQPGKGFWRRTFPEGTPLAAAEKAALDALRLWHGELMLYREEGILTETDWFAFSRRLDAENARRQARASQGQPVYGPMVLTPAVFLSYERDALWAKLSHRIPREQLLTRRAALAQALPLRLCSSPGEAAETAESS